MAVKVTPRASPSSVAVISEMVSMVRNVIRVTPGSEETAVLRVMRSVNTDPDCTPSLVNVQSKLVVTRAMVGRGMPKMQLPCSFMASDEMDGWAKIVMGVEVEDSALAQCSPFPEGGPFR